jgi:hypothetical protein
MPAKGLTLATIRCRCGALLRDDDPDEAYVLFSQRAYDVGLDSALLRGRASDVLQCRTCGRLWVFWDKTGEPTEYVQDDG